MQVEIGKYEFADRIRPDGVVYGTLDATQVRAVERGSCPCGVPLGDALKHVGVHPACVGFLYEPKHAS